MAHNYASNYIVQGLFSANCGGPFRAILDCFDVALVTQDYCPDFLARLESVSPQYCGVLEPISARLL